MGQAPQKLSNVLLLIRVNSKTYFSHIKKGLPKRNQNQSMWTLYLEYFHCFTSLSVISSEMMKPSYHSFQSQTPLRKNNVLTL
ncbi:hypothetical protein, partial [Vibrio sp. YT-19(2023)]|uniref:hypothetical protein n=1 Tax=Vibrio sp. YT-19(2023) TaxID=3074710 RepID=UPI0029654DAB